MNIVRKMNINEQIKIEIDSLKIALLPSER